MCIVKVFHKFTFELKYKADGIKCKILEVIYEKASSLAEGSVHQTNAIMSRSHHFVPS